MARKQQEQAEQDQGLFGKGLGVLIGNPLTRNILKPMSLFALPGRAVVAGFEEAVKGLPEDWERRIEAVTRMAPGALEGVDEERNAGRGVWEKITDPEYGFGSIIKETDSKWGNRLAGLTGDILLDPLTYVGGAGNRMLAAGAQGADAASTANRVASRLNELSKAMDEAAQAGNFTELARLSREMPQAERALEAANEVVRAAPPIMRNVPTGRAGRAQFLSELTKTQTPEQIDALMPDILRAGERGLNTASPALREATGLERPALRLFDTPIPGTRTLARGIAEGVGLARVGLNKVPYADTFARGPKGLEEALGTISRGTGQIDPQLALENIQLANRTRLGEGTMRSVGRGILRDFWRENVQGQSDEAIKDMIRASEQAGDMTPLNEVIQRVRRQFETMTGKPLARTLPEDQYVPHMLTPSFRRLLASKEADPVVDAFKRYTGLTTDDLLESSGFLEKARVFTPNKDGTPRTIKIHGKDLDISSGTIEELNEQLRKLFPGFKRDFYETNPTRIVETYIDSVARQAGRDTALRTLADAPGMSNVTRVEGALADALEARNAALATDAPHLRAVQRSGPYAQGQAPVSVRPQQAVPTEVGGVKLDDYFKSTVDPKASRERRAFLQSPEAKQWVDQARKDVKRTKTQTRKSMYDIRTNMMKGLATEQRVNSGRMRELSEKIRVYGDRLNQLKGKRPELQEELVAFMVAIKTDIRRLEDEVRRAETMFKGRRTKALNRTHRKLRANLASLKETEARAQRIINTGAAELKAEADQRIAALLAPVREAEQALEDARAALPRPRVGGKEVTDERVRWAQETLDQKRITVTEDVTDSQAAFDKAQQDVVKAQRKLAEINASAPPTLTPGEATAEANFAAWRQGRNKVDDDLRAAQAQLSQTGKDLRVATSKARQAEVRMEKAAFSDEASEAFRIAEEARSAAAKANADAGVALRQAREAEAKYPKRPPPSETVEVGTSAERKALAAWQKKRDDAVKGYNTALEKANKARGEVRTVAQTRRPIDPQITGDWQRLQELRQQLGRTGNRHRAEQALIEERDMLAKKFRVGGEHGIRVGQALEILEENAKFQAMAEQQLKPLIDRVAQAERMAATHQEAAIYIQNPGSDIRRRIYDEPGQPVEGLGGRRVAEPIELPRDLGVAFQDIVREPGVPPRLRPPRAEAEAITNLENRARNFGGPAQRHLEISRENRAAAEGALADFEAGGETRRAVERRIEEERGMEVAPLKGELSSQELERDLNLQAQRQVLRQIDDETIDLQYKLQQDRAERSRLIERRDKAAQLEKRLKKTKENSGSRYQELLRTNDEIGKVARDNPLLEDEALNDIESLLGQYQEELERIAPTDITSREVKRLIKESYEPDARIPKVMMSVLNDAWKGLHDGAVARGDTIMTTELRRRFENLYKMASEPTIFGRTFNAATNAFKTYATLSPGFHVRNALSAIFMNSSDGVPLATQLEGWNLWQKYMGGGETWLSKQDEQIQEGFRAAFGSGAGGRFTESGVAQPSENRIMNAVMNNRATRWSQRQGERVEGGVRLGMALDTLRTGGTVDDALQRITRIHFDYGQVSALDERMKRLIPFWTFMSRNLPMQVVQMWTKPKLYARYEDLVNNFSEEAEEYTPAYWLKAGAWNTGEQVPDVPGLGGAQGLPLYLQPDLGFTRLGSDIQDMEDFLSLERPGAVLSNVNPWLTAPVEFATKKDIFTGREFGPEDYTEVGGVMTPIKYLAAALGQTNEAGQVSENFLNAIRAVNPTMDRTARVAPQLTGGDDEAKRRQFESIARFLGAPIRTLTPQPQQSEYFRRYYEMQEEMARQRAMARTAAGT